MRKISEQNIFPRFDLPAEYRKIEQLISGKKVVDCHYHFAAPITIEKLVNEYFLDWELRGTMFSVREMREAFGIEKTLMESSDVPTGVYLDFFQYAANCANYVWQITRKKPLHYSVDDNFMVAIIQHISAIADRLNVKVEFSEDGVEVYLIYRDDVADIVVEHHPDISHKITEYRRIDNHGNLERKGEILCTLYKKFESVRDDLNKTEFKALADDTGLLFNNTSIRHWEEKTKFAAVTFSNMPPDELEIWYGKTYELFIACMAVLPYIKSMKGEIAELKQLAEQDMGKEQ